MKTLLFIIDMQNDFCNKQGTLYVQNAEKDVDRLSNFIEDNIEGVDGIILTQDWHNVIDISHACFWVDEYGEHPKPYTVISNADVDSGRWIPLYGEEAPILYIRELSNQGEYPHIIWPEHCLAGTEGAAFPKELAEALVKWSRRGNAYKIYQKGTNPYTEHFGALRANIPNDATETMLNKQLVEDLNCYDRILLAGEARSHCVANTVKQLLDFPEILGRCILLDDCTSNVVGFEGLAAPIYQRAAQEGMLLAKSYQVKL